MSSFHKLFHLLHCSKAPFIALGKMQLIFFFIIPLHLVAPGSMETEYDSSKTTILNCIFPENTTRTDFAVYLYNENGKTDLLVDCAWVEDKLACIEREGFKCRLPVPNTAEIEVPKTYVTRPSKIGYTLSGHDPSKVKICHFVDSESDGQKESKNKQQQNNIKENNYDQKESDAKSPSLESTKNNSRDDNLSQSTVKDYVVIFSTEKSSLPVDDEEKAPLNIQSEKNDNILKHALRELYMLRTLSVMACLLYVLLQRAPLAGNRKNEQDNHDDDGYTPQNSADNRGKTLSKKSIGICKLNPGKVNGLQVNGQEANETYTIGENTKVNVSCSVVNGTPPDTVRLLDKRGQQYNSTILPEGLVTMVGEGKEQKERRLASASCKAGSEQNQLQTPVGKNSDGLVYGELDFSDKITSDVIIGTVPETQYSNILFTANADTSQ
ncbi:hypothetical protein C0Q70_12456 [Pomacea canaliculata]|uniref:Uncharacterized protein n=1 Tax=Pomacea canaliculata TaxID=400727 RepID=A0A2T7P1K9_POMCA|nr:hypothetical protein C0Q70_12456 [Pomacea canaliculata]